MYVIHTIVCSIQQIYILCLKITLFEGLANLLLLLWYDGKTAMNKIIDYFMLNVLCSGVRQRQNLLHLHIYCNFLLLVMVNTLKECTIIYRIYIKCNKFLIKANITNNQSLVFCKMMLM